MNKCLVRLTDDERKLCDETIDKLVGSSQTARRARVLRQVAADGPGWTDRQVAAACRVETVENTRRRCVLEGCKQALHGQQRTAAPVPKLLDGEQEAQLIALRLGPPPEGCGNWSLRLLAQQVVALGIADSISQEAARKTLKKTAPVAATFSTG